MIELTALFVLGFFLAYLQWSKDRTVNSLLAEQTQERREWATERTSLLQRIQAPETAVLQEAQKDRKPVPKIGYEDDAAFIAARDRVNNGG
jgi:hypothetical protein